MHPGKNLTVVTPAASGSAELGIAAAIEAVRTGEIDATFRANAHPALTALRRHLSARRPAAPGAVWPPPWAAA